MSDHMKIDWTVVDLRARIATLEAQLAERVRVKPMEWDEGYSFLPAFGGFYHISYLAGRNVFALAGRGVPDGPSGAFETLDEAKAAAQADFDRRILSALEATPPAPAGQPVTLTYKNWRGEVAERTITPKRVWFGSTDWHPEPQWLLTAFDAEKQADRDFALKDFGATPPAPKVTEAHLLDTLAKHKNWELDWGSLDPSDETSECGWRVYAVSGSRNDREWSLMGAGETPAAALTAALSGDAP